MWLPKDERRLLAGYYKLFGEIEKERVYRESDLIPLLSLRQKLQSVRGYRESTARPDNSVNMEEDMPAFKRAVKSLLADMARVKKANKILGARKLITVRGHVHEQNVVLIALTVKGFDLGRRYGNWLDSTGIWFSQYRNHWLWLIAAAVGGGFVTKVIDYLVAIVFAASRR
jgi:hypothetical protein